MLDTLQCTLERSRDMCQPCFLLLWMTSLEPGCSVNKRHQGHEEMWYKQWKVQRGCLEKFALGALESNQTFPRGAALRESLITQGTSCEKIFQTIPKDFSLFVTLWASKTATKSCAMGLSGETVGWDLLKSGSVKSRLRWFGC